MNNVNCPHCGKLVEISEAIKHQVEDAVLKAEKQKHKEEIEQLKKAQEEREKEIAVKAEEKAQEKLKTDLEREKKENEESKKLILELNSKIDKLLDDLREERKGRQEAETNAKKKILEEEEKIRKEEQSKAILDQRELKKQIEDMQKALDEAKNKGSVTSQQLQGEVFELQLEEDLKNSFPFDEFLPIPKGVEGADIWQKVKNRHGQEAGSILWEIKRTKAWSRGWLPKLREDARKVNASLSIIVSEVLPEGVTHFGREEGVWISSYDHAVILANVLRESLLQVAIAKSSASHKEESLREIYEYITSEAFRHKIEAHFESVKCLKEDLESEKRAMERIWKRREVQIHRLDKSTAQMYGELQGIAGSSMPTIRHLDPLKIEAGDSIEQEELL